MSSFVWAYTYQGLVLHGNIPLRCPHRYLVLWLYLFPESPTEVCPHVHIRVRRILIMWDLPRQNLGHVGWVWSRWSIWPHQVYCSTLFPTSKPCQCCWREHWKPLLIVINECVNNSFPSRWQTMEKMCDVVFLLMKMKIFITHHSVCSSSMSDLTIPLFKQECNTSCTLHNLQILFW